MRIFTNEVATVNALARADARTEAVAWEDPLAFGRLFPERDLDAFVAQRVAVYEQAGWDEDGVVGLDLKLRNDALASAMASGEDVCLLFGGSLRDQLQLAQILAWAEGRPSVERACLRLMLIDGPLSIFDDGALLEVAKEAMPVEEATLRAYGRAWDAVTAADPAEVEVVLRVMSEDSHVSLAAALRRWLQELPSEENGLSISQLQVLDAVRLGVREPQALFDLTQETEAEPFRTNWEFWSVLDGLASGPDPLLEVEGGKAFLCPPRALAWNAFHDQRLLLTERGLAVLEGLKHFSAGAFADRWLGGLFLDASARWFWSYGSDRVVSETAADLSAT